MKNSTTIIYLIVFITGAISIVLSLLAGNYSKALDGFSVVVWVVLAWNFQMERDQYRNLYLKLMDIYAERTKN